jgi:hypothetical protein
VVYDLDINEIDLAPQPPTAPTNNPS